MTTTQRQLEAAYRELDYSTVPGNRPPSPESLRLIRGDVASREARDDAERDLIARQLAWLDGKLAASTP